MKVTSGILGSHFGTRLLWTTALVALALGIALTLLLVPGSATADGPDEFTVPIVLEEGRTPPKVVEPPSVRDVRQVITQQTPTLSELVSNLGQTPASPNSFDNDYAQAFRTGNHTDGYRLTSVLLALHKTGDPDDQPSYEVHIHENASGGVPGDSLGKLSGGTSLNPTTTEERFTAPGTGISLDANTTYWVVMDVDTSNTDAKVSVTTTNAEDAGGATGWTIANDRRVRAVGESTWGSHTRPAEFRFAVVGYAIARPDLVSAEVNGTSLVLTFDQNLNTASRTAARQFGIRFGGGALQGATRISISGRQVTLTVPEVRSGQVVTVSYTKPTSNPLKGANGEAADAFSNQPVTVNTGPAYGRLPESGNVRDAVYVTYNNAAGEEVAVEKRAASADRETLWDYFYDSCQLQRSVTTVHDYSQYTEIVTPSGTTRTVMTQARNGWKWVWVQNADGAVTGTRAETVTECANHGMYLRQQQCANEDWRDRNPHALIEYCPTDRTW